VFIIYIVADLTFVVVFSVESNIRKLGKAIASKEGPYSTDCQ